MSGGEKDTDRDTISLRVEAEKANRFNVGTRWEVVASSPESLWLGAYSVTFKEIADEADEE